MATDMNTLAVNRLLKKLGGAIASGNHQQAAAHAKELAKLKIQCSIIRHKAKQTNILNVDMFIEDRLAHQGPIPLQLPMTMTLGQLKEKISQEFQIPPNVQRWIIAKKLANDEDSTLHELNATEGLPIFLYLAAPVLQINQVAVNATPEDGKMGGIEEVGMNLPLPDESSDEEDPPAAKILAKTATDLMNTETLNNQIEDFFFLMGQKQIRKNEEKTIVEKELEAEQVENVEENFSDEDEGAVGPVKRENLEYKELMMLEGYEFVANINSFECPICFEIYQPLEGVTLRDCLHSFCRSCIKGTIIHCSEAEIKCPYRDSDYSCESTLQEREIKGLVDPDVYEQHLAKSISQAENNAGHNAFHCKTPNCNGWCIIDDDVNNFLCPVCDLTNCLTCRVIHNGKNCWEYQEDVRLSTDVDEQSKRTAAMLTDMLDSGEAMSCPKCSVVLMKKWGCDWIKCSMCKTEICWVTRGPRWGPAGQGDTSGGCKCGVNARKCHPNCHYCH